MRTEAKKSRVQLVICGAEASRKDPALSLLTYLTVFGGKHARPGSAEPGRHSGAPPKRTLITIW